MILIALAGVVLVTVLEGLVLRYGWDVVVIHAFHSAPPITVGEAIGLMFLVGWLTSDSFSEALAGRDDLEILALGYSLLGTFFTLAFLWVIHFFIPGAA